MKSAAAAVFDRNPEGDPFQRAAESLLEDLGTDRADAVVLFATWHLQPQFERGLETIRRLTGASAVVGGGAYGVVGGDVEVERRPALAAVAVRSDTIDFATQYSDLDEGSAQAGYRIGRRWMDDEARTRAAVVVADPRDFDAEAFAREFEQVCGSRTVVGGLASGDPATTNPVEICGTRAEPRHVAALLVRGAVRCETIVTTCCEPVGPALPVAEVDEQMILKLGTATPLQVLTELAQASPAVAEAARTGNLLGGYVIDSRKADPGRGDYLVRNLVGLDQKTGAIGVVQKPYVGLPFAFQRRAPEVALEDFAARLDALKASLGGRAPLFGLYFDCLGRGKSLYKSLNMDATLIRRHLGEFPLAGFHGNGELGPGAGPQAAGGGRTLLYNYSGVLAVFIEA